MEWKGSDGDEAGRDSGAVVVAVAVVECDTEGGKRRQGGGGEGAWEERQNERSDGD